MAVEQQFEIIFQGQVADVAGYRFKNGGFSEFNSVSQL
jgi:hypothetical protein